jgi:branched-chain amino acid transport system substrate-binding protein
MGKGGFASMSSLADLSELVGFFSYSREDDRDAHGALSDLRDRIQGELRSQLGRPTGTFRIWQDKEAIPSGSLWETEIKNSVAQAVFFIPIITPTVVRSPYCQFELNAFLGREAALGRSDLVFPILYIDVPALQDSVRRQNDPIISVIAQRQYVDWRELRHQDVYSRDVKEAVERFCRHIRDALERPWISPEERKQQEEAALERAEAGRKQREAEAKRRAEVEEANRAAELKTRQRAEEEQGRRDAEAERRRGELGTAKLSSDQETPHIEARAFGLGKVESIPEPLRDLSPKLEPIAGPGPKPRPWQPSRRTLFAGLAGAGALGGIAAVVISQMTTSPSAPQSTSTFQPEPSPLSKPAVPSGSSLAGRPIKIGVANPLTGSFAALGQNEGVGMQLAVDELNAKNGIFGRKIELLAEDSTTSDVGTAVQKARELIDRDKVDLLVGNVNSALATAMAEVSNQKAVLHIVPGGHVDAITGTGCKWNVFRVCSTTQMQANSICPLLFKTYGKRWHFITPDYAFGHTLYQGCEANLKKLGGTITGNEFTPLGTTDFSSYLIQAGAARPDVLIVLLQGLDMVSCLKQISQFGMDKQMHVAGTQQELESVEAIPPETRFGIWLFEWYWKQAAGTQGLDQFIANVRKRTGGKVPTARTWFGYVTIHSYALACEKAKSIEAKAVAKALSGMELPPEIKLQPNNVYFRAGDHQLMLSAFIGELLRNGAGDTENLFTVNNIVAGEGAAPSEEETRCKMQMPA